MKKGEYGFDTRIPLLFGLVLSLISTLSRVILGGRVSRPEADDFNRRG